MGNVLVSALGDPLDYRPIAGAAEINLGSPVTGFSEATSSALVIASRQRVTYLTGSSAQNFQTVELSEGSGAADFTLQSVTRPIYLDALGLRDLAATQTFGGFRTGTLSDQITPLLRAKTKKGARPLVAHAVRALDQYRMLWSDGVGLSVYLGRRFPEIMQFEFAHAMFCASSSIQDDDSEIILMGGENGYVYQGEVGTSFDGEPIAAYLRLAYNAVGSPYSVKRFHKGTLEMSAVSAVTLSASCEFSYGNPDLPIGGESALDVSVGGGVWNISDWNQFSWSAQEKGQAQFYIDGIGTNVSVAILSETASEPQHSLSSIVVNFTPRGLVR